MEEQLRKMSRAERQALSVRVSPVPAAVMLARCRSASQATQPGGCMVKRAAVVGFWPGQLTAA